MAVGGKTLTVYLAADLKKFNSGMAQAQTGLNGFANNLTNMVGPALIGAGIAAGAFATKLAVDGVKAAMDNEVAAAKLATTLENLGLAHDTQAVEDYIYQLERAYGIADTDLRPAYDRLVRSIGDTEEANRMLSLSLDIAAGTGKDLNTVTEALGKAFDGQTTGLSRLGAGLDTATLASKDMDAITRQLADTFGGQANTQAATFEGQIQRLQTAVDNLGEAFGQGLLNSLGDTDGKTQDLVSTMEDLEPILQSIGDAVGGQLTDWAYLAGAITDAAGSVDDLAESLGPLESLMNAVYDATFRMVAPLSVMADIVRFLKGETEDAATANATFGVTMGRAGTAAQTATPSLSAAGDAASDSGAKASTAAIRYLSLAQAMAAVGGSTFNWRREIAGATGPAQQFALDLENLNINRKYDAWLAAQEAAANKALSGSQTTTSATTKGLTEAEKRLTEQLEKRISKTQESKAALDEATAALEKQVTQIDDYASSMQKALTGGLDLAAAYSGQFTKEGEDTGVSLIEGFNAQIAQAEWFGNVLGAIKAQGADQTLLEEIAGLGPDVGGALGQQMLDEGLVPTLSEKWAGVQQTTNDLAMQLVPGFMTAGLESGIATVDGLATQFEADKKKLGKLGKEIAKPVGANFRAQLLSDVAKAVRDIEASATAARAEKVAQAAAQQARLTDQAVAQALGRLISNSDQRAGTNIAPVLT